MPSIMKPTLTVCLLLALVSTLCISSVDARLKLKGDAKQFLKKLHKPGSEAQPTAESAVAEKPSEENTASVPTDVQDTAAGANKASEKKLEPEESILSPKKKRSNVADAENPVAGKVQPKVKGAKSAIREKLSKVKKQLKKKPGQEENLGLQTDKKAKGKGKGKLSHKHEHQITEKREKKKHHSS